MDCNVKAVAALLVQRHQKLSSQDCTYRTPPDAQRSKTMAHLGWLGLRNGNATRLLIFSMLIDWAV